MPRYLVTFHDGSEELVTLEDPPMGEAHDAARLASARPDDVVGVQTIHDTGRLSERDPSEQSIPPMPEIGFRLPSPSEQLLRYFTFDHLPPALQDVSAPICDLALRMEGQLPDGPEKTTGLRKLLEAKDCFVRAALDHPES